MSELVVPLRVDSIAVVFAWSYDARVSEVAFGDEHRPPTQLVLERVDLCGELFEEVDRGCVDERMDRIEPQAVKVVVAEPSDRVVNEKPADLVAPGTVEVDRRSPRRPVAIGEVRPEIAEVI